MGKGQAEVSPVILVIILGVLVVAGVSWWLFSSRQSTQVESKGSEKYQEQVQKTGRFYTPPAGAPVPGAPPAGGMQPPR